MKLLLLAFVSIFSLAATAQDSDKVDFVLYAARTYRVEQNVYKFAKVEMTRERYNRMMDENLVMLCKTTSDKDVMMMFYQGQITVHHQKAREVVAHCDSAGCQTSSFEDLSEATTGAANGHYLPDSGDGWSYFMGSANYYVDIRGATNPWGHPEISEIPYVTIFDPAIHGTKAPVKNSFACFLKKLDGTSVSP